MTCSTASGAWNAVTPGERSLPEWVEPIPPKNMSPTDKHTPPQKAEYAHPPVAGTPGAS